VRAIRDADDPAAAARALKAALPPTAAVVGTGRVRIPQIDWLPSVNGRAKPHIHREHTDVFFLLDGTLEFRAGAGTVRVPAGSCVAAPPLLVHGFRNPVEGEDARYLNLHVPGGWSRAPQGTSDTDGPEHGSERVRPVVTAPGDGDRLTKPHRLAVVRVDLPDVAVVETFVDEGFQGPEYHVHLQHADCFHVLEGALEFTLETGAQRVEAGTSVVVPPGVPHTFRLASERARYLNVHAPGSNFVDYVRAADRGERVPFDQYAFPYRRGVSSTCSPGDRHGMSNIRWSCCAVTTAPFASRIRFRQCETPCASGEQRVSVRTTARVRVVTEPWSSLTVVTFAPAPFEGRSTRSPPPASADAGRIKAARTIASVRMRPPSPARTPAESGITTRRAA
jgi:mannose-6-phosphate isomerase-like protein (cupin superfamily)